METNSIVQIINAVICGLMTLTGLVVLGVGVLSRMGGKDFATGTRPERSEKPKDFLTMSELYDKASNRSEHYRKQIEDLLDLNKEQARKYRGLRERNNLLNLELAEARRELRTANKDLTIIRDRFKHLDKVAKNLREDLETANQRNALQAESIEEFKKEIKGLTYRNGNHIKILASCRETIEELRVEKQELIKGYEEYIKDLTAAYEECKASRADYAKKLLARVTPTHPRPEHPIVKMDLGTDVKDEDSNMRYVEGEIETDEEVNISGPHDPTKCPDCQRGERFYNQYGENGPSEEADCFTCNGTGLAQEPDTSGEPSTKPIKKNAKPKQHPAQVWWSALSDKEIIDLKKRYMFDLEKPLKNNDVIAIWYDEAIDPEE